METGERHNVFTRSCQVASRFLEIKSDRSGAGLAACPARANYAPMTVFGSILTPGPIVEDSATRWI